MESEYLEEENGSAKSNKVASATSAEKLKAAGLETASNKRMRLANINAWTLRYNDESLESKVRWILIHSALITFYILHSIIKSLFNEFN